jgi:hypothetical protein
VCSHGLVLTKQRRLFVTCSVLWLFVMRRKSIQCRGASPERVGVDESGRNDQTSALRRVNIALQCSNVSQIEFNLSGGKIRVCTCFCIRCERKL